MTMPSYARAKIVPKFYQNNNIANLIDDAIQLAERAGEADQGFRRHLGASLIGRKCHRQTYYSFRWFLKSNFPPRVLRLFDRGHKEERRFEEWLRLIGVSVTGVDPNTGKQFRFHSLDDHFAGSLDGIATNVPGVDQFGLSQDTQILVEYKTHGKKSFALLTEMGVRGAKPEHHAQMIVYMEKRQLPLALYCAVEKDTDELYFEFVLPDPAQAELFERRANSIIQARQPPPRISKSPSWYECKFCDYRGICHFGDTPLKNCRTCRHSVPISDGQWHCGQYNRTIPKEFEIQGCGNWMPIHD